MMPNKTTGMSRVSVGLLKNLIEADYGLQLLCDLFNAFLFGVATIPPDLANGWMHQSAGKTSNLVRIFLQILACGILETISVPLAGTFGFFGWPKSCMWWLAAQRAAARVLDWILQTKSDLSSHFLMENMVI